MLLTERQKRAENITRELQRLGATVTNVLPLAEGRPLRFWVSDYQKKELLQQLAGAGYTPTFLGMTFQVDPKAYAMGLVNSYELALPADRQPVMDDRIPKSELASRNEKMREAEALLRDYYGKKYK